jgi:hypothetical protein
MHLHCTLPTLLLTLSLTHSALSSTLRGFNPEISLDDFGPVGTARGYPLEIIPNAYDQPCSGMREGEYVCGSFEEKGVDALRAIYRCQGGVLALTEVCHEGGKKNRCVRNRRGDSREWRRFYPFVSGDKGVCVRESQI